MTPAAGHRSIRQSQRELLRVPSLTGFGREGDELWTPQTVPRCTRSRARAARRPTPRRQLGGRRPEEEEAAAAAEDPLHQPAAAGARGHLRQEQVPGHVHQGGDRHVDQPHRGQGQAWQHRTNQSTSQRTIVLSPDCFSFKNTALGRRRDNRRLKMRLTKRERIKAEDYLDSHPPLPLTTVEDSTAFSTVAVNRWNNFMMTKN
ncbi:hypothetical protein CDAR_423411 [Caerostris darwini]|uniref:Uncharacterized protein n=1 Tax=Caerostris darwini TaxID=1538125 RepID=A0AAV4TKW6_9ARAC|nr:hypothetical protein CDAR_423411 [Caerostris darwini]